MAPSSLVTPGEAQQGTRNPTHRTSPLLLAEAVGICFGTISGYPSSSQDLFWGTKRTIPIHVGTPSTTVRVGWAPMSNSLSGLIRLHRGGKRCLGYGSCGTKSKRSEVIDGHLLMLRTCGGYSKILGTQRHKGPHVNRTVALEDIRVKNDRQRESSRDHVVG